MRVRVVMEVEVPAALQEKKSALRDRFSKQLLETFKGQGMKIAGDGDIVLVNTEVFAGRSTIFRVSNQKQP